MRQPKSLLPAFFLLLAFSFVPSLFAAPQSDAAVPQSADSSHARVVTLSLVQGVVIARRPGATKWERATVNTPVEEGAAIATARHSLVEVQFENGSTVRLGELSRIDFKKMALAPHSGYLNHLTLALGVATFNVVPDRHDEYVVNASGASLGPHGRAEFRTDLRHGSLRVEVFHGRVLVADAKQSERLVKGHALTYDYRTHSAFLVADAIQTDDWDKWVEARDRQAALAAENDEQENIPGVPLYRWEEGIVPFGGMGNFPTDGF